MMVLGLTGGMGSGKSVVAELLQIAGIPVYDSDIRSKELCDTDETLRMGLIQLFGAELYDGRFLNRSMLAKRIFGDAEALKVVNALIHPAVEKDFRFWMNENERFAAVAQETAILFEAGLEKSFNFIICVTAPEDLRIDRVCKRSDLSVDAVRERLKNQISEDERLRRSDLIIVNDGIQALIPQVDKLLEKLSLLN